MLVINDQLVEDVTYLYYPENYGEDRADNLPRLGGKVMAARSGNCKHNEPVVDSIHPASISTQAGVSLTISGCNLAPRMNLDSSSSGINTDITQYAIILSSGSQFTRCNVIHYFTNNDQIICTTEEFPHSGDFFPKIYINAKEVGAHGYGKNCKTCRIRAFSNFNPQIKSILPFNNARNGDVIVINARLFTDAYEQDRCAMDDGEDDEECAQSSKVEEGENYLVGQPKFTDAAGRMVGTCEVADQIVAGEPNIRLTNFNDGYIKCKVSSNFVGNVNITFATSFNGISTSKPSLFSIVGESFDLTNFQLTPRIDSIDSSSGSIAGGNEIVLNGGPFLEDETRVEINGVNAKIIQLSSGKLTIQAPSKPDQNDSCGAVGARGFRAQVWNFAQNDFFRPLGATPSEMDLKFASYAKRRSWTAHIDGYFTPPSDGYYSFVMSASHKGRLYFSSSGCQSDAVLVATASQSSGFSDFFGDTDRQIMDKVFLKKGTGYYLRGEAYSTYGESYNAPGFVNIGALYHSTTGEKQTLMKYRQETQMISITDNVQTELQEITFASNINTFINRQTPFSLIVDGKQTKEFTLKTGGSEIVNELNKLSASTCRDNGFISIAFRNTMEDMSIWPSDRYHRTVRPFCGSRSFSIDQARSKNVLFDAGRSTDEPIDLNINPHVCFAYFGDVGEKVTVTVEAGSWRGVRSYDLGIAPTAQWKYKCINLLTEYLRKDKLVLKKIDENAEFVLKKFQFSAQSDDSDAYIDEFIIGRIEGFFEVEQTGIGISPSGGYIQKFDASWKDFDGMRSLRITFKTDDCGLDIDLIRLAGDAHFEEIQDPLTHFYTFDTHTVKVDRYSKISPGVLGNFELKYKDKVLSANVDWSSRQLQQRMAAVFGSEFAAASVTKKGECRGGYVYKVLWKSFGDKDEMSLENVAVTGINIDAYVKTLNDGGLLLPHLTHAVLASPLQTGASAQIHVFVRDILAECDSCYYTWSEKKTVNIHR